MTGATMGELISALSHELRRTVVHNTGLAGRYDVHLKWTTAFAGPDDTGASIFTAVREQLGLRLEPAQGPVDVLVIDQARHPGPN